MKGTVTIEIEEYDRLKQCERFWNGEESIIIDHCTGFSIRSTSEELKELKKENKALYDRSDSTMKLAGRYKSESDYLRNEIKKLEEKLKNEQVNP